MRCRIIKLRLVFLCAFVCQTVPSLLALMGIRFEGLIPAIMLPLMLTMVRNKSSTISHKQILKDPTTEFSWVDR